MVQKVTNMSSSYKLLLKAGAAGVFILSAICSTASAATVCVSQSGACPYTKIADAVNAAASGDTIQVRAGIYNESITITKPVTLVGAGRDRTIINAFGLANGIFIDGMAKAPETGISNVTVSGFTVENANLEGILIGNATAVTIYGNQVIGNDRNLKLVSDTFSCAELPAFETNEGEDCGEGLHLIGVHHSIIANNIVRNNAGGILLTDETGGTHDNLISGNTVSNNSYECGITLASHKPAASAGLRLPGGVYHNTISGNTSSNNGTVAPGSGAGIGIFAPGPGNAAYGNIVVNNIVTGNGLPGITLHNHALVPKAPVANLNDNVIIGNQISGNAADDDDAATPGTTGINLFSKVPVTGTVIAGNSIRNQQIGVAVNTPNADVRVELNNLQAATGVTNLGGGMVDASQNYWGCAAGPGTNGCGSTVGGVVSGTSATIPF